MPSLAGVKSQLACHRVSRTFETRLKLLKLLKLLELLELLEFLKQSEWHAMHGSA